MNYITMYPFSAMLYVAVLVISILFSYIAQKSKSKSTSDLLIFLLIFVLALLAGLRDVSVGKDTVSYIRAIESASSSYSGELFYSYFESGFAILISVLVYLLKEPHYVILVISLITNTLIIKTLWRFRENYSFSFSIFLYYTLYYFQTYNILRQYLALAIIFWGIKFLVEKKYPTFLVVTLLASSIHGAAIIGIVLMLIHILVEGKVNLKNKVFLTLLIISFVFFSNYIMNLIGLTSTIEKYQTYYIQGGTGKNVNFGFFFLVRLSIIAFSGYLLKRNGFENYNFSKFIIFTNLVGTVATMGGYVYTYAGRLGAYAIIFEIMLWSELVKTRNKSLRIILEFFFIGLGLYLFYSGLKGSDQGHMPYKLFF